MIAVPIWLAVAGGAVAVLGTAGTILGARRAARWHEEYRGRDLLAHRFSREADEASSTLSSLREEVSGLGHLLYDSALRWGINLADWFPLVDSLIERDDPLTRSGWLLSAARHNYGLVGGASTDRLDIVGAPRFEVGTPAIYTPPQLALPAPRR